MCTYYNLKIIIAAPIVRALLDVKDNGRGEAEECDTHVVIPTMTNLEISLKQLYIVFLAKLTF